MKMSVECVTVKCEPGLENVQEEIASNNILTTSVDSLVDMVQIKVEPVVYSSPESSDKESESTVPLVSVKAEPLDYRDDSTQSDYEEDISLANLYTNSKNYSCTICSKAYSNRSNLLRHHQTHNQVFFKCHHCSKQFCKQEKLENHLASHIKRFQCPDCTECFRTLANLTKHQRVHKKAKYVCQVCRKEFAKSHLYKSHLRRHIDEKPYSCHLCDMKFKYKSAMSRHIQLHDNIRPHSCSYCGKAFTHAGLLKPHLRMHTGEKPFTCPVCRKKFSYKHNMERHCTKHAKVKRLNCQICNKRFPRESRLKYHMRTHTSEKHFACEKCPKRFTHKQSVIRHYSRKHPNDTYFTDLTDAAIANDVIKIFWNDKQENKPAAYVKKEVLDSNANEEIIS